MLSILKNKPIRYLFLSCFAVLFTGMGLLPILPLYASQFQASASLIGLYLAAIYAANALGPIAASGLVTRFSKRAVFIAGGLMGLVALIFLAVARTFVQVIVYSSLLWFAGGVLMSLISILTGHYTDADSRGKAFSLMTMVGPLGSLVGGGVVGWMITRQGYTLMFLTLAVVWSSIPLIGLLRLKEAAQPERIKTSSAIQAKPRADSSRRLGLPFIRLLMIVFVGSIATNVSRFGLSLSMQAAHYSAEQIASAAMMSGLVSIPVTLMAGSFSDRLGRRHFLGISFLFIVCSGLILTGARELWQYWLASVLSMLGYSVSGAMAQAVTSEVVPAGSLDRGLSWLGVTGSVASVVCFALGGLLIDRLGLFQVFLMVVLVALMASAAIEVLIRPGAAEPVEQETQVTKGVVVK